MSVELQNLIDDYESSIGRLPTIFTIPDDELIEMLEKALENFTEIKGLTPKDVTVI